jgi:hypothetical protein
MILIEVFAIIAFVVLLLASIWMLIDFYVCDNQDCKAFIQAEKVAPRATKKYVLALLNELYNDGIWPFPYIGAAILTPLSLWFINAPITVQNFAIVFLVSFVTIYFLFSFFGHHYVRFVSIYTSKYIQNDIPDIANVSNRKGPIYIEDQDTENNIDELICKQTESHNYNSGFKSFTDGLDVTFAPPVNNF